jgi:hypothetical protein
VSLAASAQRSFGARDRPASRARHHTTEIVYRRELRPVITTGAEIMDKVFGPTADLRT